MLYHSARKSANMVDAPNILGLTCCFLVTLAV